MQASSIWLYIVPQGMRSLMNYIKQKYDNPPVIITENGKHLFLLMNYLYIDFNIATCIVQSSTSAVIEGPIKGTLS